MHDTRTAATHSTAVRVALWRAMHDQVDPPYVFEGIQVDDRTSSNYLGEPRRHQPTWNAGRLAAQSRRRIDFPLVGKDV